ncbi:hypothetical protein Cylst_6436 (plasmid) [Cylindrospermum stagnale PCC 7417]|uniref:Uncharacterized protein n=1 Tax=Cylindrospermum stagnale PCC 7417 TaxID=56107 RepID=K9X985_9NOST|nr:hypothetical protein [Cylindrospermum stagnale]AFZ28227.1 hypothetical protein Cylst_6436 [Cylindrospermum stagnale PCC 7417]
MSAYRQLTIWDVLDELSESPPTSSLNAVWECLDAELWELPVEAQLSTAGAAFSQIAQILRERANMLLQDVSDSRNLDGPIVSTDMFAGLVRTTMQLDLDDLIEIEVPQIFKAHGTHQFSHISSKGDSVAAPVEKGQVLAMLEQITCVEDVHELAGDEDVEGWQRAIANYLTRTPGEISLTRLQSVLQMPLVEVWLGLLLGGFTLEQRGDFYESQDVWIIAGREKGKNPNFF